MVPYPLQEPTCRYMSSKSEIRLFGEVTLWPVPQGSAGAAFFGVRWQLKGEKGAAGDTALDLPRPLE